MHSFSPPVVVDRRGVHRLFRRVGVPQAISVLKFDAAYQQVREPTSEQIEQADRAYLGGHVYLIDDAEAAALTTAGYGGYVTEVSDAYGWGSYGSGIYGS